MCDFLHTYTLTTILLTNYFYTLISLIRGTFFTCHFLLCFECIAIESTKSLTRFESYDIVPIVHYKVKTGITFIQMLKTSKFSYKSTCKGSNTILKLIHFLPRNVSIVHL